MTQTDRPALQVLQALLLPEIGLSSEAELYFRLNQNAAWHAPDGAFRFERGGEVGFDTAANLFSVGKWHRLCGLEQLRLRLRGAGRFELVVFQALPDSSVERLVSRIIDFNDRIEIDLDHFDRRIHGGAIYFTLKALAEGEITGADWCSPQAPRRCPSLALVVTTYRREADVARMAARFARHLEASPLAPQLSLIVVDNGQSVSLPPADHLTLVPNRNLGGAGGFARGLAEAEARGASHVIFMDDDARIQMQAIDRAWTFLAHALDDSAALAGTLTVGNRHHTVWENGALFDRICHPRMGGTDLREIDEACAMEHASTLRQPDNFYGGWWFFAFAVSRVRHRPFPFFLRGDDVSFSLMNRFDITTLPGVICFQDSDFSTKETPLNRYLDLRSHLVHHLVDPRLEIGAGALARIAWWFFNRSTMQMHYDSLVTINMAVEDVLAGPRVFEDHPDLAARRAEIDRISQTERYRPVAENPVPRPAKWFYPAAHDGFGHVLRVILHGTLNGHLVPFFGRFGNRLVLKASQRTVLHEAYGAAEITYVTLDGARAFTVRHDKRAWLREAWRLWRNTRRLRRHYPALRDDWRAGYERATTHAYWEAQFAATGPHVANPTPGPDQG